MDAVLEHMRLTDRISQQQSGALLHGLGGGWAGVEDAQQFPDRAAVPNQERRNPHDCRGFTPSAPHSQQHLLVVVGHDHLHKSQAGVQWQVLVGQSAGDALETNHRPTDQVEPHNSHSVWDTQAARLGLIHPNTGHFGGQKQNGTHRIITDRDHAAWVKHVLHGTPGLHLGDACKSNIPSDIPGRINVRGTAGPDLCVIRLDGSFGGQFHAGLLQTQVFNVGHASSRHQHIVHLQCVVLLVLGRGPSAGNAAAHGAQYTVGAHHRLHHRHVIVDPGTPELELGGDERRQVFVLVVQQPLLSLIHQVNLSLAKILEDGGHLTAQNSCS
mmetsp:Transcript_28948/g.49338  ORF Transcript_28948/g.49338 Transcript_28948/m.49338 type:complete len:327 (-) Transcript_28948:680-1660(-)